VRVGRGRGGEGGGVWRLPGGRCAVKRRKRRLCPSHTGRKIFKPETLLGLAVKRYRGEKRPEHGRTSKGVIKKKKKESISEEK